MPDIAVIGGTGVYNSNMFDIVEAVHLDTPYGKTSDDIIIGNIAGVKILFLNRHGTDTLYPPSSVPYRANIQALKELGCQYIISICAVGSLQENFEPGDLVIVDQFIDFTKKREYTYFDDKIVHISISNPFCEYLNGIFQETAKDMDIRHHIGGRYICIEGPRFSTKAESHMFKQFADIVGMTVVPECQLARELGMCYCSLAVITDYDVWKDKTVDIYTVKGAMAEYTNKIKDILKLSLPKIESHACTKCIEASKIAGVPDFYLNGFE